MKSSTTARIRVAPEAALMAIAGLQVHEHTAWWVQVIVYVAMVNVSVWSIMQAFGGRIRYDG